MKKLKVSAELIEGLMFFMLVSCVLITAISLMQ